PRALAHTPPASPSVERMRPQSPPQTTTLSSSHPRHFHSASSPAIGLSTRPAITLWFSLHWPWPSHPTEPPLFPPEYNWINRTPRSTIRRAIRHCVPNSAVSVSSRPYSLRVAAVSRVRSASPGTDVCILKASSYDAM